MHPRLLCLPYLVCLTAAMLGSSGCRAIRRFDESRQTIDARRYSQQGLKAIHEESWEVAERYFLNALEASDSDDRAHWGLAESLWQRGEQKAAIAHMEQAVRLSAGDPRSVQRLGRMYLEVGRLDDADQQSVAALEAERYSADVWTLRGDCLKARDKHDEALAAYHRALALQPDSPAAQVQAAEIYHVQGRYGRLLATLDRLRDGVGTHDVPVRADMLRGIAMRRLGRPADAQRCFAQAAQKSPNDPAPYLQIAALSLELGNMEAARQSLATAINLDPSSAQGSGLMEQLNQPPRLAHDSEPLDPVMLPQRR